MPRAAKRARYATSGSVRDARTGRMGPPRTRRSKRNALVRVPRNRLAFPQSQRANLRWVHATDFELAASTATQFQIRANSIYDPNYATQPGPSARGFDQYMDIYDAYTVLGATISVNLVFQGYDAPTEYGIGEGFYISSANQSTKAQTPVICGLHKGLETLAAGDAAQQMEKDRTKWTVLLPVGPDKTLTGSMKISDFFGAGTLVGDADYSGTKTSNPAETVFFELWCARAAPISGGKCHVRAYVTVTYDTVFTQPKTLTAS